MPVYMKGERAMKLEAFRIQNYKKISDTDWVSCCDLTAFIGKNEAGKSAIFRGLSKLNPSDGEKYDGLKEFPRRRYTDEFASQDWPVASARFSLSEDEQCELHEICPDLKDATEAIITRYYSWDIEVKFTPDHKLPIPSTSELLTALKTTKEKIQGLTAPEDKGDILGDIKTTLIQDFDEQIASLQSQSPDELPTKVQVDQIINAIMVKANEDWQKNLLQPSTKPFRDLAEKLTMIDSFDKAKDWIKNNLPRFVYFDRYDILDSTIHIPTFLQELQDQRKGPRHRVTHCLFKHVGLDIKNMLQLGTYESGKPFQDAVRRKLDELAIKANSASISMTKRFQNWWEQRKHRFRYDFQGEYFRIWVSDDIDPSEIELDQRSLGLQYFFSFYLVFLVESEGAHKNCILLLDEPGLHLHGTAQAKVIEFLDKLVIDNQTLYSTHSPFLVDGDHLERARAVYEKDDGTTGVSEDVWPRDKDSLFPLQAALGYQLVQSLFISKRQLLVEGITDYWLIKTLAEVLPSRNLPTLRADVTLVPAAGVSKLLPLASMLLGHDIEIGALLDGDEPARREGKKLIEKLLSGQDRRCLFIGDFITGFTAAEIEDIFPEEFYLSAVKIAYPEVKLSFNKEEKEINGVLNKLTAFSGRKGGERFEKWRVAAVLRDWILEKPETVPASVYETMSTIFTAANAIFE